MKAITYLFGSIFLFAIISVSQPIISVDKIEENWGDIYSGAKKKAKIIIKNIGKDTLKITSLNSSCGCTKITKRPKEIILPKQSDNFEVEFNSSGFRGLTTKYAYIYSNDPASPMLTIKLIANIKEELESIDNMTSVAFDNIPLGLSMTKEMKLKNTSSQKIKIKNFQISSPSIAIKMDKEIINPNDTLNIEVTVKPQKDGHWNEWVTLETDSKNQSKVEFRVSYMSIKAN